MFQTYNKKTLGLIFILLAIIGSVTMIPRIQSKALAKPLDSQVESEFDSPADIDSQAEPDFSTEPKKIVSSDQSQEQDVELDTEIVVAAIPVEDAQNKKNVVKVNKIIPEDSDLT